MEVDTRYANKLISKAYNTKLIETYVDSTQSWTTHTEQSIHKLGTTCYAMRTVNLCMSQKTLRMTVFTLL